MSSILNVAILFRALLGLLNMIAVGILLCLDFGIYQKVMFNKYLTMNV